MVNMKTLHTLFECKWSTHAVAEYLSVKDISSLDIAICNHSIRSTFISNLQNVVKSFTTDVKNLSSFVNFMEWQHKRKIRLKELTLTVYMEAFTSIQFNTYYFNSKTLKDMVSGLKTLSVTVEHPYSSYTQETEDELIKRTNNLKVLASGLGELMEYISNSFPNIENISLQADKMVEVQNKTMSTICGNFSQLKEVSLPLLTISDTNFKNLCIQNHNITKLTTGQIPPDALLHLNEYCPFVEYLEIESNFNHHKSTIGYKNKFNYLKTIIFYPVDIYLPSCEFWSICPVLETLEFLHSEWYDDPIYLSVDMLKSLTIGSNKLTTFSIVYADISTYGLKYFAENNTTVCKLLFTFCQFLETTKISGGVMSILGKMSNLKNLKCSDNYVRLDDGTQVHLNDDDFANLVKYNHNMEYLEICDDDEEGGTITDIGLKIIADNSPNLKYLEIGVNLFKHEHTTLEGIKYVIQKCLKLDNSNKLLSKYKKYEKKLLKQRQQQLQ